MNSTVPFNSGKILYADEAMEWDGDTVHGQSVRVLGRVSNVDGVNDRLTLSYRNGSLAVSTRLLDLSGRSLRDGTLVQVLGELDAKVLVGRVLQDMSGVDVAMYERCLRIRRDFEEKILKATSD